MAGLFVLGVNNPASAGTTTADFLTWERKAQDAFIQNSITMIGIISAQTAPKISRCIDDWYLKDSQTIKQRNSEILREMSSLSTYNPSAVLLAFTENVCGQFKRN